MSIESYPLEYSSPEAEAEEVVRLALFDAKEVDPHVNRRFVVGTFGSLSETMGEEQAEAFLDEHSLTRITQRGLARHFGRRRFL